MNRRDFAALLLASVATAGCNDRKERLPGERISVLGLERRYEPDPALANKPVTLPQAKLNPDWPQPGGDTTHAMQRLSLPETTRRVWNTSIGEGTGRYT